MSYLLTDRQLTKLSLKARTLSRQGESILSSLPRELGTNVAEAFAEDAIENLAASLHIATRIKQQLRIRRSINNRKAAGYTLRPLRKRSLKEGDGA